MIIDIHPHIISDDTEKYPLAPLGGTRSKWSEDNQVLTAEQLLEHMEKAGVEKSVVVHSSTTYGHDCSYVADSVDKYPDKLYAVGSIDVLQDDVIEKMEYWCKERHFAGLRFFTAGTTMKQADWINDPKTFPAWKWIEENDIPMSMHISMAGLDMLEDILQRFPKVRVMLDHASLPSLEDGYPYPGMKKVLELAQYPGVYLKVTSLNMKKALEGRSTREDFIKALVEGYGADRIAWGSNFPASKGTLEEQVQMIKGAISGFTEKQQESILSETARGFYRI